MMRSTSKKVCVFTGTRAEYGLLKPLMAELKNSTELHLQILVSGMHLAPEFGLTHQEIERDGFIIDEKVPTCLSSDTPVGISKAMAQGLTGCTEALQRLNPDLLIILGDRFEALSAAIAAMLSRIPIAHIHGGEVTSGVIDEPMRHAITKMSHLHFTSNKVYRRRVIQLGENPEQVFNVGALGVENIKTIKLLSPEQLAEQIGFRPHKNFGLVTFHPVTLEQASAEEQFTELLNALTEFPELKIIFTKANADTDGKIINQLIDQYVAQHPHHCQAFTSMGQRNYLSAMNTCKAVIGNSSSGIIEAPSFQIPTINIGNRQQGRLRATSVLDCQPQAKDIRQTMNKAFSPDFQATLAQTINPYEKVGTAKNIFRLIKEAKLADMIKKDFHDIH